MDLLTALVAIAHLKLRLEILQRHPEILVGSDMEIRRPMELAGLKSRLLRAKKVEADIAETGKRYDVVLDQIDAAHVTAKNNVGQLEQYASELDRTIGEMVAGSNGGPTDGDQAGPDLVPPAPPSPPYIT